MLFEQLMKFEPFWTLVHQTCQSHAQSRELTPSPDIAGAETEHQQDLRVSGTVQMRGLAKTGRALCWGLHTHSESLAGGTLVVTAISVILLSVPCTCRQYLVLCRQDLKVWHVGSVVLAVNQTFSWSVCIHWLNQLGIRDVCWIFPQASQASCVFMVCKHCILLISDKLVEIDACVCFCVLLRVPYPHMGACGSPQPLWGSAACRSWRSREGVEMPSLYDRNKCCWWNQGPCNLHSNEQHKVPNYQIKIQHRLLNTRSGTGVGNSASGYCVCLTLDWWGWWLLLDHLLQEVSTGSQRKRCFLQQTGVKNFTLPSPARGYLWAQPSRTCQHCPLPLLGGPWLTGWGLSAAAPGSLLSPWVTAGTARSPLPPSAHSWHSSVTSGTPRSQPPQHLLQVGSRQLSSQMFHFSSSAQDFLNKSLHKGIL